MNSTDYIWEYICTNTYMHAATIKAKRDHDFEGEWGGECLEVGTGREKWFN